MAEFIEFKAWHIGQDEQKNEVRSSFTWAVDPRLIACLAENAQYPGHTFITVGLTPVDTVMVSGNYEDVKARVLEARNPTPGWAQK